MADYAAMPIFIDAWALDTGHLNDAEDGRYFRLCRLLWSCPQCRIPNDDAWLARKLNRTPDEITRDIRPLIVEFFKTDANWIWHKRLLQEYQWVSARSKSQSERAKSRWLKEKMNARAVPTPQTRHINGNTPTPTPTPTNKEPDGSLLDQSEKSNGRRRPRTRLQPDWQPSEIGWQCAIQFGCDTQTDLEHFRDHHIGKGNLMADWDAAWRTWCHNSPRFNSTSNSGGNRTSRSSITGALRILEDTRADRERDGR